MRVSKFRCHGGSTWLTLRADDGTYCVVHLPMSCEYSMNKDGTALTIKPAKEQADAHAEEDAMREMGLDEAVHFGLRDVGNK